MDNDLDKRTKEENLAQANKEIKDAIEKAINKPFSELSAEDKRFLYSRRNYLSRDQRNEYKNVFKQVEGWNQEKAKKEAEEAAANPVVAQNVEPGGHPADQVEADDDGEDEVG
jgi:hypothetical protein